MFNRSNFDISSTSILQSPLSIVETQLLANMNPNGSSTNLPRPPLSSLLSPPSPTLSSCSPSPSPSPSPYTSVCRPPPHNHRSQPHPLRPLCSGHSRRLSTVHLAEVAVIPLRVPPRDDGDDVLPLVDDVTVPIPDGD